MALQSLRNAIEKRKTVKVVLVLWGVLSPGCQKASSLRLLGTFQANSLVPNEVTAALNPTELSSFMLLFNIKMHYFRTKTTMEVSATFLPEGEARHPSVLCLHATRCKMVNDTAFGDKARSYGITGWKRPPRWPSPTTTNLSLHRETQPHTHARKLRYGDQYWKTVSPWGSRCLCYIPLLQSSLK